MSEHERAGEKVREWTAGWISSPRGPTAIRGGREARAGETTSRTQAGSVCGRGERSRDMRISAAAASGTSFENQVKPHDNDNNDELNLPYRLHTSVEGQLFCQRS